MRKGQSHAEVGYLAIDDLIQLQVKTSDAKLMEALDIVEQPVRHLLREV